MTTSARKYGMFECAVLLFELMNLLQTFQLMAAELFRDLDFVGAYIDDVVIAFKSLLHHTVYITNASKAALWVSLKIIKKMSSFATSKIEVLTHTICHRRIENE